MLQYSQTGSAYSRVLEVVEAVICENKPASLPGLHSSTWGEITGELSLLTVKNFVGLHMTTATLWSTPMAQISKLNGAYWSKAEVKTWVSGPAVRNRCEMTSFLFTSGLNSIQRREKFNIKMNSLFCIKLRCEGECTQPVGVKRRGGRGGGGQLRSKAVH